VSVPRTLASKYGSAWSILQSLVASVVVVLAFVGPAADGSPGGAAFSKEARCADAASHPARNRLPFGTVQASELGMTLSPAEQDLIGRYAAAVRDNPAFWMRISEHDRAAGLPPYDAGMGLSADDHAELVRLTPRLRMAPLRQAPLSFILETEDRFEIDGGAGLMDLTGIVIDLAQDEITWPGGRCARHVAFSATEYYTVSGPWEGVLWSCEYMDEPATTGSKVYLALGWSTDTGRTILHYDAKQMINGELRLSVAQLVVFETPDR
jgi:hypothetical protein